MRTRRSFFRKLAGAAAIVGLAPRLAFRVCNEFVTFTTPPLNFEEWCAAAPPMDLKLVPFWYQTDARFRWREEEYQKALEKALVDFKDLS